jgi:hypothetical protein
VVSCADALKEHFLPFSAAEQQLIRRIDPTSFESKRGD